MPIHLPTWSQTKTTSKAGFDKVYKVVDKLGDPVNRLSHKVGAEAFWPTTLDKESEKAARILRSFCKDGFYVEESKDDMPAGEAPKGKARVLKKIPTEVIQKAKGLAIFTTMRTGLWVSGAGGSGILVARTVTGEWSPPSGIMLHTAGLGFLVGIDVYDCVIVINSEKALEAFKTIRCTLGGEISAVAGPVGMGGVLESEIHKRQSPLWTYLKSRGFYVGVQIDGTIIIERSDENERFYGERIGVTEILAGKARHPPYSTRILTATIKAAQGDTDVGDRDLPDAQPTPGDLEIEKIDRSNSFGLPASDDPDPFGVRALEKEGLEIREAGTNSRPSVEVFEYKPSPSSPIFNAFKRHSVGSNGKQSSRRSSQYSVTSVHRGTQTEPCDTFPTEQTPRNSTVYEADVEILGPKTNSEESDHAAMVDLNTGPKVDEADKNTTQPIIFRARLVTIPKRIPPALPPRNPYRARPTIITDDNPNSNTIETGPQGLGLDLGESFSHGTPFDPEEAAARPARAKKDLDERLLTIEPFRQTEFHNRAADPDGSITRKDRFDEISISGSDYSHEATALPNQHEPISNNNNSEENGSMKVDDEITTALAWKQNDENPGTAEEFHSIPNTPLETSKESSIYMKEDLKREAILKVE